MHARGAKAIRARAGDAAFVLLPGDREDVLVDPGDRPRLRDRLLGHRHQSAAQSAGRADPAALLKQGLEAVEKGKAVGAKTERERDWLAAIEEFYKDFDKVDQDTRAKNYAKAMEALTRKYPNDPEAKVFYALALNETIDFADKTYANQLKAAKILTALDATHPEHPGVAHYLIHSLDFQPLAKRGLKAARKYDKIAPSAPHALHMPSHIYTMLGMWEASIASNREVDRCLRGLRS